MLMLLMPLLAPWPAQPIGNRQFTIVRWGCIKVMEKKMEPTLVYWGYIGIMEKRMEITLTKRMRAINSELRLGCCYLMSSLK